jgi:carbamoyl-phosphate synthase small subunit
VCLNDDVVEGLECLDLPAYSVQYHPEAAAGPHDAGYLFDRFVHLMESRTMSSPDIRGPREVSEPSPTLRVGGTSAELRGVN